MTNAFWRGTIILAIERAIEVELGSMDIEREKNKYVSIPCFRPSFKCPNTSHSAVSHSVTVAKTFSH
jgi:hypothetical protein